MNTNDDKVTLEHILELPTDEVTSDDVLLPYEERVPVEMHFGCWKWQLDDKEQPLSMNSYKSTDPDWLHCETIAQTFIVKRISAQQATIQQINNLRIKKTKLLADNEQQKMCIDEQIQSLMALTQGE